MNTNYRRLPYKSKYITLVAVHAAHNDNSEHRRGTAAVEPYSLTIVPIPIERKNWAMKTELPMIETSVPSPRTCCDVMKLPSASTSN